MARRAATWAQAHDGAHLQFAAKADFTVKLRRLMDEQGLTQSELARRCWGDEEPDPKTGYVAAKNRDRISKYLSGQTVPDGATLKLLAEALNCTEEELAPAIVGSRYEREHPELRITVIAGHRDRVHITVNTVVDIATAVQMAALLRDADSRPPSGLELREREHTEASVEITAAALPMTAPAATAVGAPTLPIFKRRRA